MNSTPVAKPQGGGRLQRRIASFGYAFRGVWSALGSEVHLRFHALSTVIAVGLGFYFDLSRIDWALVVLAIGTVWSAELVNTAVEALVDLVSPDYHVLAGKAKDVAAGAVLVTAIAALVIGVLVFGPHAWALWQRP